MKEVDRELEIFLKYLQNQKKVAPVTIDHYRFYLQRFLTVTGIFKASEINLERIERFKKEFNRLNPATINLYLIALRSFLKFLKQRKVEAFPWQEIRLFKVQRNSRLVSGLEKILDAPRQIGQPEIISWRDKAVLEVLLNIGLKVSQIVSLKTSDFDPGRNFFKSQTAPKIKFSNQCAHSLKKYLSLRNDTSPYLFVSHDRAKNRRSSDSKLTPRSIQRLIKKSALLAGLTEKITPESFRKYYFRNKAN